MSSVVLGERDEAGLGERLLLVTHRESDPCVLIHLWASGPGSRVSFELGPRGAEQLGRALLEWSGNSDKPARLPGWIKKGALCRVPGLNVYGWEDGSYRYLATSPRDHRQAMFEENPILRVATGRLFTQGSPENFKLVVKFGDLSYYARPSELTPEESPC